MTPSEAAIKTLASLARLGKVEISTRGKLALVRYQGRWKGEAVQLQAAEGTLIESILLIGRQAAGRKKHA